MPQQETNTKRKKSPTRSPINFSPAASPPRKLLAPSHLEKDLLAGKRDVSNLALGHAIAFDDDKAISAPDHSGFHLEEKANNVMLETMKDIYWENLQKSLNENSSWFKLIPPLSDIKSTLTDLLPKRRVTTLHTDLSEKALDLTRIKSQIDADVFDLNELKSIICLVIDIMSKVCAPVRDTAIESLRTKLTLLETGTISNLFVEIFNLLQAMQIDMANFSIQAIRPLIKQQQVEYERSKMIEYLNEHGDEGLTHAKHWLMNAFYSLKLKTAKDEPQESISPIGPNRILDEGFFQLMNEPPDKRVTNFYPETVLLDRLKFEELYQRKNKLAIIAAVMTVASSIIHRTKSCFSYVKCQSILKQLRNDVNVLLTDRDGAAIALHVEQVFSEALKNSKQKSIDLKDLYKEINYIVDEKDNKVRKICNSRFEEYINAVCQHTSANQYRLSGNKSEAPVIPKSLHSLGAEVASLAKDFTNLVILNKTIHGPFYSKLIKQIYDDFNKMEKKAETGSSSIQSKSPVSSDKSNSPQTVPMTPRKTTELKTLIDIKGQDEDDMRKKCVRSLRFDDVD